MNVRSVALIVTLLLPAASLVRGQTPLPETVLPELAPILRQAVEQSPRMLLRSIDLEMAENNRIAARAAILPNIGGSYSYYQARDDRADLPNPVDVDKVYYNASITQPVFYWGERRNTARIGAIQKDIAEGNYQVAYRALAQELRSKYLGLIVQKLAVERTQRYREHAKLQARLGEERLAKRVISDAELYPIQLAAEQADISLERAQFDYQMAKQSFARLAGIDELRDDQIPNDIPVLSYADQTYAQKLSQYLSDDDLPSIEAVNMRHQMQIEELNYKNQRTRLLPKFNLVVGSSQDEQSYTLNAASKYRVNSLYAGVSVNWTIFDGFSAQAGKRNALARRRQIRAEYEDLIDRLSQQAQILAKQINFSARNMAILDRAVTSGEGYLKTRREDNQRGVASETDVRLAELGYYDARINAFNARIEYLMKNADFLGTLNEDPALSNLNSAR